jgi:HSP20 family protein
MRRIFSGRGGSSRRRGRPLPADPAKPAPGGAGPVTPGLVRLRSELDRLFDRFFGPEPLWKGSLSFLGMGWAPSVDVIDAEKEFTVRAEMPGLDAEDIQLSVTDTQLILAGEKKDEHEDRWKGFVRSERRYGSFRKVIPIPVGADSRHITADYDKGVLTVHLPKSELRKPRQIAVSAPPPPKPSEGNRTEG